MMHLAPHPNGVPSAMPALAAVAAQGGVLPGPQKLLSLAAQFAHFRRSQPPGHLTLPVRGLHRTQAALQQPTENDVAALGQVHTPPLTSPHHQHHHHHGGIDIVIGPMFAGKTSELLRRAAHYEAQGLSVAIVKSDKDNRYSGTQVVTHDGVQKPCFAVPSLSRFRQVVGEAYTGFHVIAIDEAQFFPDLAEFCTTAADHDAKRIVLAGLDGDFLRKRFGQVLDLVPLADSVTKLTAMCLYCLREQSGNGSGAPALFSLRIAPDNEQEVVGGADKYAPVCRRHYVQFSSQQSRQSSSPPL